jgi:RNA polymerase sigma factor (sigma-70 family)
MMAYASLAHDRQLFSPSGLRGARAGMRHRFFGPRAMNDEAKPAAPFNDLLVLVGRARDRRAFEALFAHFAPRIKGYLLRLGAGGAIAEDLAQETMLVIWRKAQLFDATKASASTWIFTIARNLRIDALRRERRPDFDPNDPALVPAEEPEADVLLMRDDDDSRLHEALRNLSPEQAQVVQMSFFADKPHSLIAAELGLPLGTVKSRLRLAMVRIRAALGAAS